MYVVSILWESMRTMCVLLCDLGRQNGSVLEPVAVVEEYAATSFMDT